MEHYLTILAVVVYVLFAVAFACQWAEDEIRFRGRDYRDYRDKHNSK